MKKTIAILVMGLLLIIGCDKTEKIAGLVGKPIYMAPVIESPDDTLGCTFSWSFVEKPDGSNMDVLSFQPNSRTFNVYFVPDIEGEYLVRYAIIGADGKEKSSKELTCEVTVDTSAAAAGPVTEEEQIIEETVEAPPPVYEEEEPVAAPEPTYRKPQKPAPQKRPSVPSGPRGQNIPKVSDKYTIQISSWRTYAGAEKAITKYRHLGLDLYIQKAYFSETGETWYRVRTGTFDSYRAAKQTLNELKRKLPREQLWVDYIREDQ